MENSSQAHYDEQRGSEGSWREWGRRQSELRNNRKCGHLFSNIPDDWHEAALQRDFSKLDEVKALNREGVNASNYTRRLRALLMMERTYESIDRRRFDMFEKRLVKRYGTGRVGSTSMLSYYGISLGGLSDGQFKLMPGDSVILHDHENNYEITTIDYIIDDFVALERQFSISDTFWKGQLDIFFVSSGFSYTFYQRGLDRFDRDSNIRVRLFRDECSVSLDEWNRAWGLSDKRFSESVRPAISEDRERLMRFDRCQQSAILTILGGGFCLRPYILLGAPGTGKTHTLAEAIVQIYTRRPHCKILFCANSNTCVNQMANRLKRIPLIQPEDTCRLFPGRMPDGISRKQIVLTTNMMSASLMGEYDFDYVFIDDAGSTHEAESLLPICCLAPTGRLVLAGDPKQLGPVVECEQASEYGLGVTLFDRLLKSHIYQWSSKIGGYRDELIEKLHVSYRCDWRILSISNILFYKYGVRCVNETPKSLLRMMHITNPLQLHYVEGQEKQLENSSSLINLREIDQCVDLITRLYKMGLTPDQIGVISPEELQAEGIRMCLNRKLNSLKSFLEERFREVGLSGWLCKIGSVDAFQGNEREVIIISTVRTGDKGEHAIINDPRRFNVAISRAKWLVFVIGHEGFLHKQSNWTLFVRHASQEISRWPAQSESGSENHSNSSISCTDQIVENLTL